MKILYKNNIVIAGLLTEKPVIKQLASGNTVVNTTLATTINVKDENEESGYRSITQFHRVTAFGYKASILDEQGTKGANVEIEGSVQYDSYIDRDVKKYATNVIARSVTVLSSTEDRAASRSAASKETETPDPEFIRQMEEASTF